MTVSIELVEHPTGRVPDLDPFGPNFAGLELGDLRTWATLRPCPPGTLADVTPELGDRLVRVLEVARYHDAPEPELELVRVAPDLLRNGCALHGLFDGDRCPLCAALAVARGTQA